MKLTTPIAVGTVFTVVFVLLALMMVSLTGCDQATRILDIFQRDVDRDINIDREVDRESDRDIDRDTDRKPDPEPTEDEPMVDDESMTEDADDMS
ncbi:MAG: hypothetical protein OXP71_01050 [Candidatus Poribacteria bacterium]|nr:hypothetical protein [Candidatus Poribacteria bacterium]